jgi:hypothetical protein
MKTSTFQGLGECDNFAHCRNWSFTDPPEMVPQSDYCKGITMLQINKTTGEINTIQPGGLYAPLPVPAYQVLARMKDHQAQRVLMSIVSHLGENARSSFPSYTTIAREAGVGRNSIRKSLDTLTEYGFIRVFTFREGKKDRNIYYIQEAAFNSGLMNKFAQQFRTFTAVCRRCGCGMDRGGYGTDSPRGPIHFGCGGSVRVFKADGVKPLPTQVSYLK